MFYPECAQCAENYPHLDPLILEIDKKLATLPLSSIISPDIIAQVLNVRTSEITGIFELLYSEQLLIKKNYYECPNPRCEHLIEISQYNKAIVDGDSFECPQCEMDLTKRKLQEVTTFRFNPERYIHKEKTSLKSSDFFGKGKISILFLSADPTNVPHIRTDQEFREIKEKLSLARFRDVFALEQPQLSVRSEDISQALLDFEPRIVHFSGHGTPAGELCFEDRSGEVHRVDPDALADLFSQFTPQLVCVILNACYSEEQAKAISKSVSFVIGMNDSIGDEAAISYSIGFYQALGAGHNVEKAHQLGCAQIRMNCPGEHLTPILYKKCDSPLQ